MRSCFVVCGLLVACGDNAPAIDASPIDAPEIDAPPDTPPPAPGCDWSEVFDGENFTAPETTNLVFGSQLVMCGRVDRGHTNRATMLVDSDAFGFSLAMPRAVRVELAGTGLEALRIELAIVNGFGDPLATTVFVGTHALVAAVLPAGSYGVKVRAIGSEPATAIDYKATVTETSICRVTAAASYTEAGDGAGTGNDTIDVRFTGDLAMRRVLTAAGDAPEPTALVAGSMLRISGTSANVDAADDFHDRDTYEFTTGATIDTLTVRLDWNTAGVDLDVFVFPANTVGELAGASHVSTSGPEVMQLAVAPSTSYWLWIGGYDTSTGLPAAYDASLCGE